MKYRLEWLSEDEGSITFLEGGEPFMTLKVFLVGEEEAELRIQDVVFLKNDNRNKNLSEKLICKMTKCISESFRLLWEEGFEETILVEPKETNLAEILDSTSVVCLAYKEYMMKREFSRQKTTDCGLPSLCLTKSEDGYDCENAEGTFFCRLLDYEKTKEQKRCFYLYEVEVDAVKRNQGIATACLRKLFELLAEQSPVTVYLQVGSYNEPAVHLYEKLEFEISEELRYYTMAEDD
ncbi:MAG: GNAT family N-acetyltransferase [Lachnospiraceae bacterium]|nr:GNAT family N-acetyltransferase [Lachnospiraceae bacterium]